MSRKIIALLILFIIYSITTIACLYGLQTYFNHESLIINLFIANLLASLIICSNCIIFDSFSINDLYWNLQASFHSIYLFTKFRSDQINLRSLIVLGLVNIWSIRLAFNLITTTLSYIGHEDWRFTMFREKWKPKAIYFLMGFISFILLPNTIVFFGSMPMYYVFSSNQSLNYIDLVAIFITVFGIIFESMADYQLARIILKSKEDKILYGMDKGLWSLCRHPNYFGEITFWFGLYMFGLSSGAQLNEKFNLICLLFGPLALFSLIYFASISVMEERQLKRRAEFYKNYMNTVKFKILPLNFIFNYIRKKKSLKK